MQDNTPKLETFYWMGFIRYRCPHAGCRFAHRLESGVFEHWQAEHAVADAPRGPLLFDHENKPLSQEIELPAELRNSSIFTNPQE